MKNFNIEQLERKTPYTIPEDFFEKMQRYVMSKTIHNVEIENETKIPSHKKASKIFTLNYWAYSVAASVIVIFGLVFILKNNTTENQLTTVQENILQQQNILENNEGRAEKDNSTHNITSEETNTTAKSASIVHTSTKLQKNIALEIPETTPKDKITPQNSTTNKQSTNNNKNISIKIDNDTKVEQVLNSFTDKDISTLANNSENDVYLDLYN